MSFASANMGLTTHKSFSWMLMLSRLPPSVLQSLRSPKLCWMITWMQNLFTVLSSWLHNFVSQIEGLWSLQWSSQIWWPCLTQGYFSRLYSHFYALLMSIFFVTNLTFIFISVLKSMIEWIIIFLIKSVRGNEVRIYQSFFHYNTLPTWLNFENWPCLFIISKRDTCEMLHKFLSWLFFLTCLSKFLGFMKTKQNKPLFHWESRSKN